MARGQSQGEGQSLDSLGKWAIDRALAEERLVVPRVVTPPGCDLGVQPPLHPGHVRHGWILRVELAAARAPRSRAGPGDRHHRPAFGPSTDVPTG